MIVTTFNVNGIAVVIGSPSVSRIDSCEMVFSTDASSRRRMRGSPSFENADIPPKFLYELFLSRDRHPDVRARRASAPCIDGGQDRKGDQDALVEAQAGSVTDSLYEVPDCSFLAIVDICT